MNLEIVKFDEKVLRQTTYPVNIPIEKETQELIDAMTLLLAKKADEAVGLAAPQVNRSERLFVANIEGDIRVFINPEIVERSDSTGTEIEGCLSLPGVTVRVKRPKIIRVNYYDEHGVYHPNRKFKRWNARVIQHEYDHLLGKVMTDYTKKMV